MKVILGRTAGKRGSRWAQSFGVTRTQMGPVFVDRAVNRLLPSQRMRSTSRRLHDGYGFVVPLGLFVNITMPGCTSQMHTDAVEFRGVSTSAAG